MELGCSDQGLVVPCLLNSKANSRLPGGLLGGAKGV